MLLLLLSLLINAQNTQFAVAKRSINEIAGRSAAVIEMAPRLCHRKLLIVAIRRVKVAALSFTTSRFDIISNNATEMDRKCHVT